jgi:hypothetical protein
LFGCPTSGFRTACTQLSVRVQFILILSAKLTSIGPTSMARATQWVSTRHGQIQGTDTCYQASWHCGRWAKQSVSIPVRGRSRRPPGQLALRQMGKVAGPAPMAGRLKVYHTREGSSIGICHSEGAPLRRVVIGYRCGFSVSGLSESCFASEPWVGRCAFWLLHGRTAAQVALRHRDCLPATLNASSKATPPFRRGG